MSSRLRLDLIVRGYDRVAPDGSNDAHARWSWRLWAGSRIVSTSGSQLYSRRIDCARGAEIGTGVLRVVEAVRDGASCAYRLGAFRGVRRRYDVEVRLIDERTS